MKLDGQDFGQEAVVRSNEGNGLSLNGLTKDGFKHFDGTTKSTEKPLNLPEMSIIDGTKKPMAQPEFDEPICEKGANTPDSGSAPDKAEEGKGSGKEKGEADDHSNQKSEKEELENENADPENKNENLENENEDPENENEDPENENEDPGECKDQENEDEESEQGDDYPQSENGEQEGDLPGPPEDDEEDKVREA